MQKYQNNVQTLDGRAIVGASVTVTQYPGGAPATVYNQNGSGVITQPILTNGDGEFAFYAANGRYQLQITGGGISVAQTITDVILFDPSEAIDAAEDAGDLTGVEFVPVSRGSGVLKTTLTAIAQWTISTFQGFTSAASGAIALTVAKTLGLIPIYPEFFGANGDGTDDTAALQAWLNALGSGAVGMLSPGKTYGFTNLTIPNTAPYVGGVIDQSRSFGIVIDGQNAVLKKIAAGSDPTYGIAAARYLSNSTSVQNPICVRNLSIHLNGFATTAGLITQHWNSLFENVNVFGAAGHGWMQTGIASGGAIVSSTQVANNWVGCYIYANGGKGLFVNASSNTNNTDGVLDRVQCFDNALANVDISSCAGWKFSGLHCWNFNAAQTDTAVTKFSNTSSTVWDGCLFDYDSNNTALPVCSAASATISQAGTFSACYFYGECSVTNSTGTRAYFSFTANEFTRTTSFIHLNGTNVAVASSGNMFQSTAPFQSATTSNYAMSDNDLWPAMGVRLHGIHWLKKGGAAPYTGGYAYEPLIPHKYDAVASGATYQMDWTDALWQIVSSALTANKTFKLPPKENISNGQKPFEFHRQSSATGAFNVVIQDGDTSSTIAQMTTAGTYQKIMFDGTNWRASGAGTL